MGKYRKQPKLRQRPRGKMPPPAIPHPDLKKELDKEISRTTKVEDEDEDKL